MRALQKARKWGRCDIFGRLPLVLFGRAHPIDGTEIFVGDNCSVGTGATILGPTRIGNNVTIAAGAVVTKYVPDNVVVAGVPAKIVKYKK